MKEKKEELRKEGKDEGYKEENVKNKVKTRRKRAKEGRKDLKRKEWVGKIDKTKNRKENINKTCWRQRTKDEIREEKGAIKGNGRKRNE